MRDPVPPERVAQELARARGARRLLPWAALSAVAGAALGLAAGGGTRSAGALLAMGLLFSLFLWMTSIPRCPSCGARLRSPSRPAPASAALRSCPRCRTRFDQG